MSYLLKVFLALSVSFSLVCPSLPAEEDIGYAYGEVQEVRPDRISVTEYDYEAEEEVNVVYKIDNETRYEDVTSPDGIKAGDEVEIEYTDHSDGSKHAVSIRKDTEDGWPEGLGDEYTVY